LNVVPRVVGLLFRERFLAGFVLSSVGIEPAVSAAMSHVTSFMPTDDYYEPVVRSRHQCQHVRVLRWTFENDEDETVTCELGLTGEDSDYELRVPAQWNPTGAAIERFDDALTAFQRHAMIERMLLDDGWVLRGFESERITLH
jgi:hypothetical protein